MKNCAARRGATPRTLSGGWFAL